MIERPERHVRDFASAGADIITVHAEATPHVDYALNAIREAGCRAGLAVCPSTPLDIYPEVEVDLALCMTVNPGWGGQPFITRSPEKVRRIRALVGGAADVEVDGGIDAETAAVCAQAGATLFVAGSSVFGAPDPAAAYAEIVAAIT
jgi:ribulose-phosphate 3-epimerase